jgi:hypothetical protein
MEIWESYPPFFYSAQGRNPIRTAPDLIFLLMLQSVQNTVSATPCCSKLVTPKPSIICERVNDHWKPWKVLYNFGIQLMVAFCIEQSQCHLSLLLLLIEAKLS